MLGLVTTFLMLIPRLTVMGRFDLENREFIARAAGERCLPASLDANAWNKSARSILSRDFSDRPWPPTLKTPVEEWSTV